MLARRICSVPSTPLQPRYARRIDDGSIVGNVLQLVLHADHDALEVDIHDKVPFRHVQLGDG